MNNLDRFSALYFRDFRLFLIGQLLSLSGTWMQSVAQGWLVYSLTKSPLYLGLVAAASSLPILFFTLIGGVVADRFKKRNLLLLTQALSIIPALLLGILTSLKAITVGQVALLAAFLGMVNAFDVPARQSFLVEMVGKGHLLNAIALNSAAFNGARIIGPVIAGLTIAYLGLPSCFYLNALSFVAVIISLSMMKVAGDTHIGSGGFLRGFSEGFHFVRKERDVLYIIILIAIFSLFGIPYMNLLPVFAEEILNAGPKGLGFLVSAAGLGAFSAAMIIAFKRDIKRKGRYMSVAGLCFSLSLLAVSASRVFWLSLLVLVFSGWGIVSLLATANSFVQLSVPDNLRGRVMGLYSFVFLGLAPIGNSIIGIMADILGTTQAVAISSLLCLVGAILFSIRHLKKNQ